MSGGAPLTLGTAGHVDHGKTALVRALTGVDTDRLPEERARGLSIALGYAPLALPSGRRLSLVDVPGHERFVRTMVAGATGVDCFLLVVAADDGVMPQTREHLAVLRALDVRDGVVAVTKADRADPEPAAAQVRELLPGTPVVACSARTGEGVEDVRSALAALAARVDAGAAARSSAPAVLHVDRAFTLAGQGAIVTGTLWAGTVAVGDALSLLPAGRAVRVRGLQVHDAPVDRAGAGQRVAVNLTGVKVRDLARGDVLAGVGATVRESRVLDVALQQVEAVPGERVQVHHGTRDVPGRLALLGDDLAQLRLEQPVVAAAGDRLVLRRQSPPDTLGGAVVLDPAAGRHGRRPEILTRLRALREGEAAPVPTKADAQEAPTEDVEVAGEADAALGPEAAALFGAGLHLTPEAEVPPELKHAGVAVRVSGRSYLHVDVLDPAKAAVLALIEAHGSTTLAQVRDALGTSRRTAQALLEHLDAEKVTRRHPDDSRTLRRRARATAP